MVLLLLYFIHTCSSDLFTEVEIKPLQGRLKSTDEYYTVLHIAAWLTLGAGVATARLAHNVLLMLLALVMIEIGRWVVVLVRGVRISSRCGCGPVVGPTAITTGLSRGVGE